VLSIHAQATSTGHEPIPSPLASTSMNRMRSELYGSMRASYRSLLLLAALPIAGPAAGTERLAGVAVVVNADTVDVGDQRVRL